MDLHDCKFTASLTAGVTPQSHGWSHLGRDISLHSSMRFLPVTNDTNRLSVYGLQIFGSLDVGVFSEVCGHLFGMPSGYLLLEAYQVSVIRSPPGSDKEPNIDADGGLDGRKLSDKLWSNPLCARQSWKPSIATLRAANTYSEVGWKNSNVVSN